MSDGHGTRERSWIEIDGRQVPASPGQTVMRAAAEAGIAIPGLCASEAGETWTSCMVCLVRDRATGRLIPSCTARAEPGLSLESDTAEVLRARKAALELILADHRADCRAPCARACPAGLEVPELMRRVRQGDTSGALEVVARSIALPGVVGAICSAPCERSCHRRGVDESLAIRALERFAAGERDRAAAGPAGGGAPEGARKSVVVVGAGPAGLAAAFHLLRAGHRVLILDRGPAPGGALTTGVPEDRLPRVVIERDVAAILALGGEVRLGQAVGPEDVGRLRGGHDAVVLATGAGSPLPAPRPGVFSCGAVRRPTRLVARGLGDGLAAAREVDAFLRGGEYAVRGRFDSHVGRPGFPEEARPRPRVFASAASATPAEVRAEAWRCMQCDCAKADSCALRDLATTLGADQKHHRGSGGVEVRRSVGTQVVHQPHKCILCGRCVEVSRERGERWGMAFRGRGMETRVLPPFDRGIDDALARSGPECARVCPTGALSLRGAQPGRFPAVGPEESDP